MELMFNILRPNWTLVNESAETYPSIVCQMRVRQNEKKITNNTEIYVAPQNFWSISHTLAIDACPRSAYECFKMKKKKEKDENIHANLAKRIWQQRKREEPHK